MSRVLHNINKLRHMESIVFEISGQRWVLYSFGGPTNS